MMRRGVILVEVVVAAAVFAIGVLAIAAALTFSLGAINRSRDAVLNDAELARRVNAYMADMVISHDVSSASAAYASKIHEGLTLSMSGDKNRSIKFSVCRFGSGGGKSGTYYVMQRED